MLHRFLQINRMNFLFTFLIFFISCKNLYQNQKILIKYDNKEMNDKEKEINSFYKDKFYIVFEKKFSNDLVEVFIDNKREDYKKITTDNISGEASVFSYNFNLINSLVIVINNKRVILKTKDVHKYKYLYITNENDNIKLLFSNVPRYYA